MRVCGQAITSVPIAKNQGVIIGIAAVNRDEETWGSDANEWRPERWLCSSASEEDGEPFDTRKHFTDVKQNKDVKLPGVYSGMCVKYILYLLHSKTIAFVQDDLLWRE
jgi:hypothetical protein